MSLFLGKIHFWLYNKIQLEEKILEEILDFSKEKNIDITNLIKISEEKFGKATIGNLEDLIDNSNIHGWLQSKIASVESRLAYTVTELLKNENIEKNDIEQIFYKNGVKAFNNVNLENSKPEEIYTSIYDFVIEGMPCDRVNEVIENEKDYIKWNTAIDIHKNYWDLVNGDVENYNKFRVSWIKGFLENSNFKYNKEGNINIIERI